MNSYGVINLAAATPLRFDISQLKFPFAEPLLGRGEYPDLLALSPWLVDLSLCPNVIKKWREHGRWQSWGYTLASPLGLLDLLKHLKKFNVVKLSSEEDPVLFRYFDPDILLAFLKSVSNPQQRERFFQNIDSITVEDKENWKVLKLENLC